MITAPQIAKNVRFGITALTLTRWTQFHALIDRPWLQSPSLVWRGQRRDEPLRPRLDRRFVDDDGNLTLTKPQLKRKYEDQLERFHYAVRGRRGANPGAIGSEDEWWALGQHTGLETPLLDWTELPYAALYFAYIEAPPRRGAAKSGKRHRVVYALNERKITNFQRRDMIHRIAKSEGLSEEEISKIKPSKSNLAALKKRAGPDAVAAIGESHIHFVRPHSDENLRLLSQGGLFTRTGAGEDLETLIAATYAGESEVPVLLKLHIPEDDREPCLRTLNRMNMNHRSLFPDLAGAGLFCNMHLDIPRY